jgi:hypothetical protein
MVRVVVGSAALAAVGRSLAAAPARQASCAACEFYAPTPGADAGTCAFAGKTVSADGGCGEFQPAVPSTDLPRAAINSH